MAKQNVFQHETVPGSAYYNPTNQPNPWDRMQAEGYSWNYAGENIAAGYSGAEAAYTVWWNSSGHRQNMHSVSSRNRRRLLLLEFFNLRRYYAMKLGRSGSTCFFSPTPSSVTPTPMGSTTRPRKYRGVHHVASRRGVPHSYFDLSSAAGSFAIPIKSIASTASVQVALSNTTAASVTLSLPRDYRNYTTVT